MASLLLYFNVLVPKSSMVSKIWCPLLMHGHHSNFIVQALNTVTNP